MRIARCLPLWLVALAWTGCAGYKLGPSNGAVAGGKSVQVMPFSNQTMEPRLGEAATAQLRKELQRDGTYQLASHDDGDVIVSGVIVRPYAGKPGWYLVKLTDEHGSYEGGCHRDQIRIVDNRPAYREAA